MRFPLPFVPALSYKGGNGFGASREKVRAGLKHAANDLAARKGTPVLAMDWGIVLSDAKPFFRGTYALEIRHPDFIARYCEIDRKVEVGMNDIVLEGQVIGYVGDQPGDDMLHIEFFTGELQGELSQSNPPYDRRADIFDGSSILDAAANTVTHWPGDYSWRYNVDAFGSKFVQKMDLRDI
jgi:hypothetical protein